MKKCKNKILNKIENDQIYKNLNNKKDKKIMNLIRIKTIKLNNKQKLTINKQKNNQQKSNNLIYQPIKQNKINNPILIIIN